MADISTKLFELAKSREKEREIQNRLLEISQKISNLKRKISEDEIKQAIAEKEHIVLTQECSDLKIQSKVQLKQVEILKLNANKQRIMFEEEKDQLEKVQERVWEKMKAFINRESDTDKDVEADIKNVQSYLKIRREINENQQIKNNISKLKGEIYGLEMFEKFQQKKIYDIKKLLVFQEKCYKNN